MTYQRQVTPVQARTAAKNVFLSYYPDGGAWFDVAWRECRDVTSWTDASEARLIVDGLHAASRLTTAETQMVELATLLVEVCLLRMPRTHEVLFAKLDTVCKLKQKGEDYTGRLREILSQQLDIPASGGGRARTPDAAGAAEPVSPITKGVVPVDTPRDSVVWSSDGWNHREHGYLASREECEALVARKDNDYDVFILGRTVSARIGASHVLREVTLGSPEYWMLVVLLRYRPRRITSEEMYRVTLWDKGGDGVQRAYADIYHLRYYKHDLQVALHKVKGFSLPRKNVKGYACDGIFRHCAILDKRHVIRATINLDHVDS